MFQKEMKKLIIKEEEDGDIFIGACYHYYFRSLYERQILGLVLSTFMPKRKTAESRTLGVSAPMNPQQLNSCPTINVNIHRRKKRERKPKKKKNMWGWASISENILKDYIVGTLRFSDAISCLYLQLNIFCHPLFAGTLSRQITLPPPSSSCPTDPAESLPPP